MWAESKQHGSSSPHGGMKTHHSSKMLYPVSNFQKVINIVHTIDSLTYLGRQEGGTEELEGGSSSSTLSLFQYIVNHTTQSQLTHIVDIQMPCCIQYIIYHSGSL